MPRVKTNSESYPRTELVKELAHELVKEEGLGQPLIIERKVAQTERLHVFVIWDRWREVPPADRSGIIFDAYDHAEPSTSERISIAMGVTTEEGMRLNLLPYSVALTRPYGEGVSTEMLIDAMKDEGASLTRQGWQLRFPTQVLADTSLQRLNQRIPGGYWVVVQQRGE